MVNLRVDYILAVIAAILFSNIGLLGFQIIMQKCKLFLFG